MNTVQSIIQTAPPKRLRSITRTVRMDEDVDEMFQNISEEQRTSVNFLINKALRRYSEWEVYAEKFGFLSITGKMFEGLLDRLSLKDARELGKHVAENSYHEFVNFYFKKFNYETVLKTLELLGQNYARAYVFERNYDGDNDILILNHGSGLNTSAYFAEIIRGLMQSLGYNVEISETEDQIVATVPRGGASARLVNTCDSRIQNKLGPINKRTISSFD